MIRRDKSLETRPDGSRVSLEEDGLDSLLTAPATLPQGTLLCDGRLRIEKRIGRGAMGEVYVAFDLERGERLALKLLLDPSGEAIYRIKQEFRSVAELVHDNLVRLYELFEDEGRWFFTMELVSGRHLIAPPGEAAATLSRHDSVRPGPDTLGIPSPPALPQGLSLEGVARAVDVAEVRRIFAELARGIIEIHDKGKLHRDLKPTNVLLTDAGRVVILDFGLVTDVHEQESARQSLGLSGTPAYMAPEVIAGEPPTEACDWYAFGVMLYETLAGRLPFEGSVSSVLSNKQLWSALPPALVRGEEIDAELEQLCVALLRRDPAERATRARIETVLATAEAQRPSLPIDTRFLSLRPGFFGREEELEVIERSLEQVGEAPRIVFVPGESGMGKSALLDEASQRLAATRDVWLLRSGCYEREQVPFKAFDGALDALCNYLRDLPDSLVEQLLPPDIELLARLFPALNRIGLIEQLGEDLVLEEEKGLVRTRAFRCLAELLTRLGRTGKVVLVLDDLQWMDMDSVRMLMALLTSKEPVPFLLIGAYRCEEVGRELSAFLTSLADVGVRPRTLLLSSLPEGATTKLIGRVADGASLAELGEMARDSAGSPYFAIQLAFFHREGVLRPGRGLFELLSEQVGTLPEPSRRLLQAVCLCSSPARRSVLVAAVGLQQGSAGLLGGLRQARLIRLLDAGGDPRVCPYHDRVRQAVLRGMSETESCELHAALADAWQQRPEADPEVVLAHLLGAGRRQDAGPFARLAAEQATRNHAYDRAASRYQLALELLELDRERQLELRLRMAESLGAAGYGARAAEAFLSAAELCTGRLRTDLRFSAARHLLEARGDATALLLDVLRERGMPARGPFGRGMLLASASWRSAFGRAPRSYVRPAASRSSARMERFDAFLSSGVGLMFGGDLELCVYFFLEATRLGRDCGEPGRVAIAVALDASAQVFTRAVSREAVALQIDLARELLQDCHQPWVIAHAHLLFGQTAYAAGALPRALADFEAAEQYLSALVGSGAQLAEAAAVSGAFMRLLTGDLGRARRAAVHAVELGEARSQPFFRKAGHYALGVLALADGDSEAARLHVARLLEKRPHEADTWFDIAALHVQAHIDVMCGQPAAHLAEFDQWEQRLRSLLHRHHYRPWLLLGYAVATIAVCESGARTLPDAERRRLWRRADRWARELCGERGLRILRPCGFALRAAVAYSSGAGSDSARLRALDLLARAEEEFANQGALAYRAMVRLHRGRLMGGEDGQHLSLEAAAQLGQLGVKQPLLLAAAYFPGLGLPLGERALGAERESVIVAKA